jgi:hypothetical protein
MAPGKAGDLLGERLKGANKTVSRPRRLHLCLPPLQRGIEGDFVALALRTTALNPPVPLC